jgi:hypothetical protein
VLACWLVACENAVQLAACPGQQITSRGNLAWRPCSRDLHEGSAELLMEIPQGQHCLVHGAGHRVPGRYQLLTMRLYVYSSRLGQVVDAPTRFLFDMDEALILEQLEGRVH